MFLRRIGPGRVRRWLAGKIDAAALLGLRRGEREDLLWEAQRRVDRGRLDEAEPVYRLAAVLWPRDPLAQLGIGVCRQAAGDLDSAIDAYSEALRLDPENVYALANRAECRFRAGDPAQAGPDLAAAADRLRHKRGPEDLAARVEQLTAMAGRTEVHAGRPPV